MVTLAWGLVSVNLTLSSLSKSRKQLYLNGPPHLNISLDPPTLLPCPTSSQQVTHMIQVNMVFTLEDKRVLVRELSSSSHLSLPLFPPLPHPIFLSPSSLLFLIPSLSPPLPSSSFSPLPLRNFFAKFCQDLFQIHA